MQLVAGIDARQDWTRQKLMDRAMHVCTYQLTPCRHGGEGGFKEQTVGWSPCRPAFSDLVSDRESCNRIVSNRIVSYRISWVE
jgi:hypothetical protein